MSDYFSRADQLLALGRLSDNVTNLTPLASPFIPSRRVGYLAQDQMGPLNWDRQRSLDARTWDDVQMHDEITGFNQQRLYPGLSTAPGDVALRQYVDDALSGRVAAPNLLLGQWGVSNQR